MAKDSVTIVLNGEVTLSDYAKAMSSFSRLILALSEECASGKNIRWTIESLETGSALGTFRGVAEHEEDIRQRHGFTPNFMGHCR